MLIIREWFKTAFTCQNPSCRKVFDKPLKALNLQQHPDEPYSACPYCLTKIPDDHKQSNNKAEKIVPESILRKEKQAQNKEKPSTCHYQFGYLSERERTGQIPDECIFCKDILECMLKKMR